MQALAAIEWAKSDEPRLREPFEETFRQGAPLGRLAGGLDCLECGAFPGILDLVQQGALRRVARIED